MRSGIAVALIAALAACPPPEAPDAGPLGGGSGQGGGSPQGGGQGGGGPTGDHCGNAIELQPNGSSFTVDLSAATDDYPSSCAYQNQTGGRELVYHVNLPAPRSVTFSATGVMTADPVLSVRASPCASGRLLACADGSAEGDTEVVFIPYATGDLWFFVDAWSAATSGELMVSISFGNPVPPPPNDACASATPLTFAQGRASASGDTTGADNSNVLLADGGVTPSPSCSMTAPLFGQDVVFSFTVGQGKNAAIALTAADGGLDPAAYLRSVCDSTARADELACGDGTFTLTNLDAGTYYLWVDGLNGSFGPFDLNVTLSDYATPPLNDACVRDGGTTGASVLPAGGGVVNGTLAGASSDIAASCGAGGSPDVAYVITTTAVQDLIATVTTADPLMQPVVFIRDGCGLAGFDLACAAATGSMRSPTATAFNLPPGTYVIWVESLSTPAAFTLDVQVRVPTGVPPNDVCTGAVTVLSGVPSQLVSGSTRTATDNGASMVCGAGAGPDVVYRFTLLQPRRLEATVLPTEDGGGYLPMVHLRGGAGCSLDGGLVGASPGCASGGSPGDVARLIVSSLDSGTYYLVVDGLNGTRGAFDLDLATFGVASPAANDTCPAAAPLSFVNGVAQVLGSTRDAGNQHGGAAGCIGGGPDVVYGFRTPDAGLLDGGTVNLKAIAWTHNAVESSPRVYVQRGCFPDAGSIACDPSVFGPPLLQSRANAWGARPGTQYTVWLDNAAGEPGGAFTLQLSMAVGPPANDACAGAAMLPLNTTVAGSTLGASNHFFGTVAGDGGFYAGSTACGNALPGADVVYAVQTPANGLYVIRAGPERGFNVAIGLTTACAPGACLDTVDSLGENFGEVLSFTGIAGATYYVTVDSSSDSPANGAARGGFTLAVESP